MSKREKNVMTLQEINMYLQKKAKPRVKNYKKQEYGGRWYHSRAEAGQAMELDLRQKAGEIKSWRPQVKIDLRVHDRHICNYFVDFEVTHNDDSLEWVEVKGFETEVYRLKRKILEAMLEEEYRDYEYTVIKVESSKKAWGRRLSRK